MAEYVDFHYMPLEGKITGKQVLKQTEDAINDLGEKVYSIDIDSDLIQQAIDDSQTALDTAEEALSVVTTDRAIWYNNVGELIQSNAEAGVTIATKGYYIPNDGGNGFYIVRNKQSADVDDGGSIIFMDSGRVAELIVTDEVNINQFGGVGDGTTDDNVAIVNAVAYASAKNKRLVFLEGYTYYTSLGIVIANPPTEIRMDGGLSYKGSGTALTIGQATTSLSGLVLKLNVTGVYTHTANSNGVLLYNVNNSQIYIYDVRYFGDTAVEFRGSNSKGFCYNSIFIGILYSTPILLKLHAVDNGWVNENKFFGGRFATVSSDSFINTIIAVLLTGTNTTHILNNNIFYSPSMELKNGVKIEYGSQNRWYDVRTEGNTNPFEITGASSCYNYMSASYGSSAVSTWKSTMRGLGLNLYVDWFDTLGQYFEEIVFDSGNVSKNIASNGTRTSWAKLINCYQGNTDYADGGASNVTIDNGELKTLTGYACLGAKFNAINNKSFLFRAECVGKYRIIVFLWDSDGNLITDGVVKHTGMYGTNIETLTPYSFATAGKNGYITGADTTDNYFRLITVPANCAKAFFGILGNNVIIKRMQVKTKQMEDSILLQNYETAILSSIPTSAGKVGQFVKKTTPTVDCIGWTYDGTNWLSVGEKGTWLENVASLRSSNLPVGIVASTKGYYSANDGGNGTYNIRAASSDVDNGGSIIILNNGNVAELITDGTANVRQYGAVGDGTTDDTSAFQNMFAGNKYQRYRIPKGNYSVGKQICNYTGDTALTKNVEIFGDGYNLTKLKLRDNVITADNQRLITLRNNTSYTVSVSVHDFYVDMNRTNNHQLVDDSGDPYALQHCHAVGIESLSVSAINVLAYNLEFYDLIADGVGMAGDTNKSFDTVMVRNIISKGRQGTRSDVCMTGDYNTFIISDCDLDSCEVEVNRYTDGNKRFCLMSNIRTRQRFDIGAKNDVTDGVPCTYRVVNSCCFGTGEFRYATVTFDNCVVRPTTQIRIANSHVTYNNCDISAPDVVFASSDKGLYCIYGSGSDKSSADKSSST